MNRRGWNLRGHTGVHGPANPAWKGDDALETTKRARARRAYALSQCDSCDQPATDRHHKDGDTGNNVPENIARLCRRCHMLADGRLSRFIGNRHRAPRAAPKPCVICERPYKPLRKGRCAACSQYLRVHGVERPASLIAAAALAPKAAAA